MGTGQKTAGPKDTHSHDLAATSSPNPSQGYQSEWGPGSQQVSDLPFDHRISNNQELTFHHAKQAFTTASLPWSISQEVHLHMLSESDGLLTNTALLVSDQCPFTIKCARFEGDLKTTMLEHHQLQGSLLRQINEAMIFLNAHNQDGLWPQVALHEALINAVLHRNYRYTGPTLINVFESRMEIVSLGGLVDDMEVNDLLNGICQPRNTWLVDLCAQLHLNHNYGVGIQRIMESYANSLASPQLRVGPSSVAVVLPKPVSADQAWPDLTKRKEKSSDEEGRHSDGELSLDRNDFTEHSARRYAFPSTYPDDTDLPSQALRGMRVIGAVPIQTLVLGWGQRAMAPNTSALIRHKRGGPPAHLKFYPIKTLEEVTLHLFADKGVELSRTEIEQKLNLNKNQTAYLLRSLTRQGKISRHGASRATRYSLP